MRHLLEDSWQWSLPKFFSIEQIQDPKSKAAIFVDVLGYYSDFIIIQPRIDRQERILPHTFSVIGIEP